MKPTLSVFIILLQCFTYFYCQTRILEFHGFSECPDGEKNPAHFNGIVTNLTENVYVATGEIKIDEYVASPLEVFHRTTSMYTNLFIQSLEFSDFSFKLLENGVIFEGTNVKILTHLLFEISVKL